MADSDDEYDRKRRDKFRGERSSGDNYRSDRRDERSRGRDDWPDRRSRPDYREYRPRDRFSPDRNGPPIKRMRGDWGDDRGPRYGVHDYGSGGGGYGNWPHDYPPHQHHGFPNAGGPGLHGRMGNEPPQNTDLQTQPSMMTLKQFLVTQDDSISDSDAIEKYNEYKLEFKRLQLNEFFVAHKDEEWFKIKYHPEDSLKRKDEQLAFLKKRSDVFLDVLDSGLVTTVNVDTTQTDKLLRLLDTVVIKLEGGTDEDLKVLDDKPVEPKPIEANPAENAAVIVADKKLDGADEKSGDEDDDVIFTEPSESKSEAKTNDDAQSASETTMTDDVKSSTETGAEDGTSVSEKVSKKRKRTTSGSSSSSHSSSSSSSGEEDDDEEKEKPKATDEESELTAVEARTEISESEATVEEGTVKSADDESMKDGASSPQNGDQEKADSEKDVGEVSEGIAEKEGEAAETEKLESKENDVTETIDLDKEGDSKSETDEKSGPRALHRTSSIFLRNLAPTITKSEVEAMCKRYSGFLRVAIADPLVERRWFRRGWVTFKRDINIKEICWNLNNIRLRDCELGAIVNRDLSRRVRPVNGITAHKAIVRSDIKLCAKIAHNLDQKASLWIGQSGESNENGNQTSFGLNSSNPVLQNITDYLIEEASAEEDELLGLSNSDNKESEGEFLERDQLLVNVLDKLILYLRIVHSVDFYNHCEYPYEDEMPNRCGIIHARGPPPQNKVTANEIQEYIRNFESKMISFLTKSAPIEEVELKKLGVKDVDAEVEKFVEANTEELGKDKWLCPLSGKKFKGPEFIRKHIFNKHGEKVDEVKKEVEYFNNYLKDPKRPQLPEHPGNTKKAPAEVPPTPGFRPGYPGPGYMPPYNPYGAPMMPAMRPRGNFGGRRGGGGGAGNAMGNDYRPIIHYRDLDAPREPDDFL